MLLVQGILRAILSSYQRFGWINSVNAAATTAQWAGAVLLAWRGFGLAWVVGVTVVARMLATIVYGVVLSRILPRFHQPSTTGLATIFKLLRFGSWVTVSQLISPVLVYLDRMLIASFVSLGAVTLYTVPYEVMTRLRLIPSSMMSTLYPAFSERGVEGQQAHLQHLYERTVRYLLLVLLPAVTFLVLLGSDVLTIWMGAGFARQTVAVLEILALGALANGMAYVPYNMLQAVGRPDLTGKFHLLELPFYLALCFAFVPRWGIAGAALASTVRFALDAGLLFWAVRRYCNCSLKGLWTPSFRRTLALTLAAGGCAIHYPPDPELALDSPRRRSDRLVHLFRRGLGLDHRQAGKARPQRSGKNISQSTRFVTTISDMSSPLVSIITPTYNHEAFIAQCIESVLAQTYSNWEQIIIDDGSTDKTAEIVRQCDDPRIRYFHQENAGIEALAHTYNRALGMARGSLVAILEGDDFWPADKLSLMAPPFEDSSVVLAYGEMREADIDGNPAKRMSRTARRRTKLPPRILNNDPPPESAPYMLTVEGHSLIPASTAVLRRAALQGIGGFQYVPGLRYVDHPTFHPAFAARKVSLLQ